jgi:hypothetical protein
MSLPSDIASAIGANMHHGPVPMSSFGGGAGLPSGPISNGPSQAVDLGAVGMDGMTSSHVGSVTGSHVVFGNPRIQIQDQRMMDYTKMKQSDVGDKELCWMDLDTGAPGIDGQDRPHAFACFSHINWMFRQPSESGWYPYEKEDNTYWFDNKYKLAGVMLHEQKSSMDELSHCQVFTSGGQAQMWDIFQAYSDGRPGPDIGALLFVTLKQFTKKSKLDHELGSDGQPVVHHYWQLVPSWSAVDELPPQSTLWNFENKSRGKTYIIGRVLAIYGSGDRAAARRCVWNPTADGSYKADLLKLRRIDVRVGIW